MATDAKASDGDPVDQKDPRTREMRFGERLDSGRGWRWWRKDPDEERG